MSRMNRRVSVPAIASMVVAAVTSMTIAAPATAATQTPCGKAPTGYNVIVSGNATIVGTSGKDFICATGNVKNRIKGLAGNDIIHAGAGKDRIWGGPGNDIVYAGTGDDEVRGGTGDDRLFGQDGKDTLIGEAGKDRLVGGAGNDSLRGGSGNDMLFGQSGTDTLVGGPGADASNGGPGTDTCLTSETKISCELPVPPPVDTDGDGLTDDVDPHPLDVDVFGPAGSVVAAVAAADPGDTLYVHGDFVESVEITKDLTISGDCAAPSVFTALPDASTFTATNDAVVEMSCVVAQGQAGVTADQGAGFLAFDGADVTLTDVVARAQDSGMYVAQVGSSITATGCRVEDNHNTSSAGHGAGVVVFDGGAVHLDDCVVDGNSATQFGGGLFNKGTMTVTNSTVTDNEATDGAGLFMWMVSGPGHVTTISNTTFSGNVASGRGGGVFANSGSGSLTDVVLTGNAATTTGGAVYETNVGQFAIDANTMAAITGNSTPQCTSLSRTLTCDPVPAQPTIIVVCNVLAGAACQVQNLSADWPSSSNVDVVVTDSTSAVVESHNVPTEPDGSFLVELGDLLSVGDVVTVTSGPLSASRTYDNSVTVVSDVTQLVSGQSAPNRDVEVEVLNRDENAATTVAAASDGAWSADFSAEAPGPLHTVVVRDNDTEGDLLLLVVDRGVVRLPSSNLDPGQTVQTFADDWTPNSAVDVTWSDAASVVLQGPTSQPTDADGFFSDYLASGLPIDGSVEVSDPATGQVKTRAHDMTITSVDTANDTVSGTGPVGEKVVVTAYDAGSGNGETIEVTVPGTGTWTATFTIDVNGGSGDYLAEASHHDIDFDVATYSWWAP